MAETAQKTDPDKIPVEIPAVLPVFPLNGVLLLPRGNLPLNIFEPRYKAMVEDALAGARMIGIIQPRTEAAADLYKTGCVGRITSFEETDDGRYLITLTGLCRFDVAEELGPVKNYRRVKPDAIAYTHDFDVKDCLGLDREDLKKMLRPYFDAQGLSCDLKAVDEVTDDKLITCLSMVCPLDAGEKQALLEAPDCHTRAKMFMTMIKMALHGSDSCKGRH